MRSLFYVLGILLCVLAASMSIPMTVDLLMNHEDWKVFLICMIFTAFFGGALVLTNQHKTFHMTARQTFILTTLSWVVLALFAAAPFALCELNLSLTDALFESVSGITTTGSTILTNIEAAPPGILLWRALLQWLGGIGIIVMALSVLPFLKVGGMQLFQTESSESEKALPRATQLSLSLSLIYVFLTMLCAALYNVAGMNFFDSMAHAMTTISTGGFSTYDSSFSDMNNLAIELIAILFMILGALPFILYVKFARGDGALFRDTQVITFLSIAGIAFLVMFIYYYLNSTVPAILALREAGFNVVSILSGTGYANGDYSAWGGFAGILMFFLMVIGGCAGSASCGIKIFRFQILYAVTISQLKKLVYPNAVFTPHYHGQALPEGVAASVMSFFFVYALCFSLLAIGLSFVGLDFMTAMSGSATTISNVGPGLGDIIGPSGTFAPLPDAAKWMMSFGMILGRLELFTVLVLFVPYFWRR